MGSFDTHDLDLLSCICEDRKLHVLGPFRSEAGATVQRIHPSARQWGNNEHSHPPRADLLCKTRVQTAVRSMATDNLYRSAHAIVQEAVQQNFDTARPIESLPCITNMVCFSHIVMLCALMYRRCCRFFSGLEKNHDVKKPKKSDFLNLKHIFDLHRILWFFEILCIFQFILCCNSVKHT